MATEPEPERLEVSDGTDTVVLTSARNGWLVELRVEGDDDVRRQRLLEAATQTVMLEEGGRLELWIEDATPACDRVPLAAGWTKVHADETPPAGEIYAIAVDPDFHGRGLGRELLLDGLAWLAGQGLRHGMLYVESDNRHANRLYDELGFRRSRIDRAFQRIVR